MPPDNAVVFKRKLSDALIRSLTEPGKHADGTSMLKSFQRIWPEYDITAHGFRATYRTIAHEHLGIDPIVLELSLSHRMPGALGAVYARAQLLA